MTRHRNGVELYWSKEEFPHYDAMIGTLARERNKEFSLDYPERDFAAYRGIASEGWPTFDSYPVALDSKDEAILDWNVQRQDVDNHNSEFTKELNERLSELPELEHDDKLDFSDATNKDIPDWHTDLFYGLEKNSKGKEADEFSDLFVGEQIEPLDKLTLDKDLGEDKEIEF